MRIIRCDVCETVAYEIGKGCRACDPPNMARQLPRASVRRVLPFKPAFSLINAKMSEVRSTETALSANWGMPQLRIPHHFLFLSWIIFPSVFCLRCVPTSFMNSFIIFNLNYFFTTYNSFHLIKSFYSNGWGLAEVTEQNR